MSDEDTNPKEEGINPIESVLDQLNSLLNAINNKQGHLVDDSELPLDIHTKLAAIEAQVKLFQSLSEEIVAQSEVSREEILKRLHGNSEELPPEGKRLVQKANAVQRKAEIINEDQKLPGIFADESLPPSDQETEFERSQVKTSKKSISKRRRKFQGLRDDRV